MTPDLRRRFVAARPTLAEQQALARAHRSYREAFQVEGCLSRPPPLFGFFRETFDHSLLGTTPQGHAVLLIKLASLCALPRALRDAGLSPEDFSRHMAFVWTFMFERLVPHAHPSGRMVLVADCRGIRLGVAMSDGQVAARALGTVAEANPERMAKTLVVNAPNWFNLIWKMMSVHLSESTRAKVSVLTSPSAAAAELARHLGPDLVPAELGGSCQRHFDEYPAQKALLDLVRSLGGGGC